MILSKNTINELSDWYNDIIESGGTVLIDKDIGWTSFDVVAKLRGITKIKKIGHAGTLDPLATGLLIICLGKATKTIDSYQNLGKMYQGDIRLGATTKTDDSEGEEENIITELNYTDEEIINVINSFIGEIEQIPPMFSAKKVNGQKLYELARKNKIIELKPSIINIYNINIKKIDLPFVSIEVECAKGTYIRALARDIGRKLGCGGYLSKLRRIAIGEYNVDTALTINEISEAMKLVKENLQ